METPELSEALRTGDLDTIRSLLDAGADIRYVRPRGYTAMVDVMYRKDIDQDPELLPILQLLIDRGADINAMSDDGESAITIASRDGRFDAVLLLLERKADFNPLDWTGLHLSVVLGNHSFIKEYLGPDYLFEQDHCSRTPLHICMQMGNIELTEMLLAVHASSEDRGYRERTPLIYAIESGNIAMVHWLLERGVDVNAVVNTWKPSDNDEQYKQLLELGITSRRDASCGETALHVAASRGDMECIRVLLNAGADPNLINKYNNPPIASAPNLEVARLLVAAGADFAKISDTVRDELTKLQRVRPISCTREEYNAAKFRVFGKTNPELMNFPFWQAMVANGGSAYHAKEHFGEANEVFEAVWCYHRFGTSFTELPDGRVIEIGGEHEDFYDQDFCIYNDVVVHRGDGTFDIYGCPREVFPPTDFHTATLVGNFIYIIGNVGYGEEKDRSITPVYRLNIDTLAIEVFPNSGDSPGAISDHRADLVGNGIEVSGGQVVRVVDGKEALVTNQTRYRLDLNTRTWSQCS